MCSRNAPGPVKDRSGLRRGMCSILPLFTPGLAQPGACAGLKPANFCRPVPGDRLDERTAGRYVCHVCVMFVSYLCHNCVIYEQKFNFSAGRPPDRPKAKKGPSGFLCCNIKIKKPRLHARAHHARMRKIIYITMLLYIYFRSTAFCQVFCTICFHVFQFVSIFFYNIYIYIL